MDDKPSGSPKTVPEEIQIIVRHWDEIDKSNLIRLNEGQGCSAKDGEIAVVRIDELRERFESVV